MDWGWDVNRIQWAKDNWVAMAIMVVVVWGFMMAQAVEDGHKHHQIIFYHKYIKMAVTLQT